MSIWPACTAQNSSLSSAGRQTLNADPFNVLAEELAMEHCKQGYDIAPEDCLCETDMVITSCGSLIPGTPDGGFYDAQGLLMLVQVVRVPLLPAMGVEEVADILYNTVLVKIVKSQEWMRQTGKLPHEFIIFCWLPPVGAYQACLEQSDALLWTEALVWPFTLRVEVPPEPGGIFPACFGMSNYGKKTSFGEVHYFLNPSDFTHDDDDETEWNLFDLDFNDELMEDAMLEDMPSNLQTVIALAIQIIEQTSERPVRTGLAQGDVFVFDDGEEDCTFAKKQDFKVCYIIQLHDVPKRHQARERDGLSPKIDDKPSVIQGLPWWDAGRCVLRSCVSGLQCAVCTRSARTCILWPRST